MLEQFDQQGISLNFLGFINIESGIVSLATQYFQYCEDCSGASLESIQYSCAECGRNTENYIFMGSGDGDGIYVVFTLTHDEKVVGLCAVFDSNYELANKYRNKIESGEAPSFKRDDFTQYFATHYFPLGDLSNSSSLVIGDQYSTGPDNDMYVSLKTESSEVSDYKVFGYFERAEEFSAENQIGVRKIPTMRALFALEKQKMTLLSQTPGVAFPGWNTFLIAQISQVVKSHVEPMADSVRQLNRALGVVSKTPSAESEPDSRAGSTKKLDRYCSNCGEQYKTEESKFCGACGSPRL